MRILLVLVLALIPAAAESAQVRLVNLSRPLSSEFQIGDRFEIRITGTPGQPISVRTARQGQTDWGPVIASTDSTGRWSTAGEFGKSDFGGWSEIWTVGGALATPAISFSVTAPCLPGGRGMATVIGPNMALTCDTAEGGQTFVTPSSADPLHTPDGRSVAGVGPGQQTVEQYHTGILEHFITNGAVPTPFLLASSKGGLGDETADLIGKLIGVNALNEKETENVLAIIRGAFARPETIALDARAPLKTLPFLQHLAELTNPVGLKQQISDTIAYVQSH